MKNIKACYFMDLEGIMLDEQLWFHTYLDIKEIKNLNKYARKTKIKYKSLDCDSKLWLLGGKGRWAG